MVDANPKWNTHKLKAAHLKLETTESEHYIITQIML